MFYCGIGKIRAIGTKLTIPLFIRFRIFSSQGRSSISVPSGTVLFVRRNISLEVSQGNGSCPLGLATSRPMVLHSQTGTPINIIEAMNAQIQRRMQIFRTARITDDPSVLLEDIANQINTQRRPDRGNLTPLELRGAPAADRTSFLRLRVWRN